MGYEPSTEEGFTFMFQPPGSAGYTVHWALLDGFSDATPEPSYRRLSEKASLKMLVTSTTSGGWTGIGFSRDGAMVGSGAFLTPAPLPPTPPAPCPLLSCAP